MKIELKEISIREVVNGYKNSDEEGVVGYGGNLNIRPKYQREFVYKDSQQLAVIDTVLKEFPLNVMYWVKNKDDSYEVLDGQQRTLSICKYVNGDFSFNNRYFHNLTEDIREKFLDYKLMIYICQGEDSEKLNWFKTINIAGEKLTNQELRNAVYSGMWVTDLKRYFSKNGCPAYQIANKYLNGASIRQEYLEKALEWISDRENTNVEDYMGKNQLEKSGVDVWMYFQNVISWVETLFIDYRKEQKGVEWGILYNRYKDKKFNPQELKESVDVLMLDEDVTNKKGIYSYLITGEEKSLNIRAFSDKIKREVFEQQGGECTCCKGIFDIKEMEADHITPWSEGGKTEKSNCQMLCKNCNRRKSNK